MKNLEPGWLMKTCHDAHIRIMAGHSPEVVNQWRVSEVKTPIIECEAQELFDLMNKRFILWTGKSLSEVAVARAALTEESGGDSR